MADQKFWIVYGDGGEHCSRYTSLEHAQDGARVCAAQKPGSQYVVLEAVSISQTTPPPVSTVPLRAAARGL